MGRKPDHGEIAFEIEIFLAARHYFAYIIRVF
jgi:hypothetical protein